MLEFNAGYYDTLRFQGHFSWGMTTYVTLELKRDSTSVSIREEFTMNKRGCLSRMPLLLSIIGQPGPMSVGF